MIERPCKECGQIFKTFPCVIKEGKGKFCSIKCYREWQQKAIASGEIKLGRPLKHLLTLHCQYCGKEFEDFPSKNRKYCCWKCSRKGRTKIKTSRKELRKLRFEERLTLREIADHLGCTSDTVLEVFKRHKISTGGQSVIIGRKGWREKHRKQAKVGWGKRLGFQRRLSTPISRMVKEDTLVNFVIRNPHVFGYRDVFLYRTSDFDLIGVKDDGSVERVEIEHDLASFLHHHHPENCDRVIAYYGTKKKLQVPFSLVEPKQFIPFAEKLILLANERKYEADINLV